MWTRLGTAQPDPEPDRGTLTQRRRAGNQSVAQEQAGDETYFVQTKVQSDVYEACFIISMRALRDQKLGTVMVAYLWVIMVIVLTSLIMWHLALYQEPAFEAEMGKHATASVQAMQARLQEALYGGKPLHQDSELVEACADQPPVEVVLFVHFVWGSKALAQFSQVLTFATTLWSIPMVEIRQFTVVEENGDIVVVGKTPFDGLFFGLLLVLPKFLLTIVLWLVGTENLMLATDFWDLLFRAVNLWYITTIERQIFSNFVAHSKKDWVRKSWVVQQRNLRANFLRSWPSEVARMILNCALLGWSAWLSAEDTQLRDLCHDCMTMCPNTCVQNYSGSCQPMVEVLPF